MSWVKEAIAALGRNEAARVRPLGGSMRGRIESGQLVTIAPAAGREIQLGDAVFVRWKGNYLLHLVKEIRGADICIGNNLGKVNGCVARRDILGVVVRIED